MKKNRIDFKEKRRYAIKKVSGKTASVFIGATIFGVILSSNLSIDNTKADTVSNTTATTISNDQTSETSNVVTLGNNQKAESSASNDATEKVQQNSASNDATEKVQQNSASNDATEKVRQGSASNNTTANNSTEAATTSQSAPKTQGSADTDIKSLDIRSLTAISAAKLATMNLMQTNGINGTDTDGNAAAKLATMNLLAMNLMKASGTDTGTGTNTGSYRSAATVTPDNINDQPAKENQELANEHNLTSSDNYSSNIYQGKDGKYYKIITIYGNDYVYRAADIQASGANWLGRPKQTAEDIKNNINISKEDLGNGKTRWTVVFFPNKGLQNYHSTLNGLSNAKFGIALTSDYQIVGNVDMDVISDPKQSFVSHTFKDNSNRATDIPVQNPSPEVKFSFNPNTDVDPYTGLINSKTMPAYNNKYLQGPYYFTTATSAGTNNLWQTYFKDADERKNAYDGTTPYLGGNHDFHVNTFKIANETGVDGAKYADSIIYDKRGGVNGVFSSDNFNQAMEFKSQGYTGNGQSQFSSYVISFTTQHTDSHEVELTTGSTGSKNQQFSGISANIYSFQNDYYSMMSSLYGEQRALDPAGALVEAKKIIPHWGDVKPYMDKIKQDYLNNAQISVLRNKILNNITDPGALNNIVNEGNSLNGAMKKLGNSIGQYDDGSFADHKEDTTKASDRYKYANPDKQEAYDNATEVTKALINKDTGTYADQATVEKLTEAENKAWSALDGVKPDAEKITPNVPSTKEPVANTSSLTDGEKAKVQKNVEDANKGNFPEGTKVTVGADGTATINYPDKTTDTIEGSKLVRPATDAEKTTPNVPSTKEPVANTSSLTDGEKAKVQKNVEDANKGNFPEGTKVTVGADGTATINYPDKTTDTIEGSKLVRPATDAEKTTPNVPSTKEPVANTSSLTDGEKAKVQKNVEDANKGNFPEGTKVTVGADGTATINYPDKTTDTIEGSKLVRPATDAEKTTPNVPSTKEPVANTSSLTDGEKAKVQKNVEDANKGNFPEGTKVTVGADGTATINYPDKTTDTIEGSKLVRPATDAEKITPNVPSTKEPVANTSSLTDGEKAKVQKNVEDANKGNFPEGTKVTVGADGTATINYPDKTTDTIEGSKLVRPATDAEKTTPNVPSTKEPVANTSSLTDGEKAKVQKNVEDANKGNFPEGTKVTVGADGTATINYPDKTTDTIEGSKLVRPATDAEKTTPNVPSTKEPVANTSSLTDGEKAKVQKNVEDANKGNFPEGTKVTVGADGTATINYPDKTTDTIEGSKLVRPATDAEKTTPNVPSTKEPVANTSSLTDGEKAKVQKNVEDANKGNFPDGTTVTVGDDGTATINYKDGSKDTIPGDQLVQGQKGDTTDADKITPTVPGDKVTVKDPSHLTDDEKNQVKNNVDNANKDKFPGGTDVKVGDDGTTTVTYPDGSKDTIPGDQLVQGQKGDTTDADKITPTVPGDKVTVKDPSHLTDDEKNQVKNNVDNANKDKFPGGTDVKVGDDGTTTVTYPDGSKDTIPGDQLVQGQKGDTTDADKITPTVPGDKVTVKDPSHLTDSEKDQVKTNVTDANKDKFPGGTDVKVGDDGTTTVTYPDGSKDTIPGDQLVQGQKGDTTDADKITPTVPGDKVTVKDPSHLTDDEKNQVKNNVDNANKDKFPGGTDVKVGDDGTTTVTYPDGSKDTIPGDQLVQGQKGDTTDADKITPTVPGDKVTVKDPSHLTDSEKDQVKTNVTDANKDKFPGGTDVKVGDDGTTTVTYPDGSKDTIPGDQLVQGQKGDTTDADKITPTVPGDKVTVKDPSHLTDDEKNQVKNNVDNANKDKFPGGTDVKVGDDGTTTVTYPDGSKDTIPGDQLVQGQKGDTTDADKIIPTVPGDKVTVKDPSHLTDDEKNQVKNNVDNANKDKFPGGTDVKVGDDGTTTVTYPDGSKDTIPGDQLVQGQKGDTTDAGKITPTVPGDKVTVKDPSHLTDDEKNQVKNNVDNANKDKFPAGTEVTVGDDGTATVTYPDGSKDTIPGDQLVQGQKGDTTDAGKITPTVSGDKVTVKDPSHLTDDEKNQVKNNVDNANKDKFPAGTEVTVGDDGTATVTYPDGSKDTIPGDQLVQGQKGDTTDAGKITPTVPGDKVTVKDPSHLTDDEKNQVKNNVDNANKDKFPGGTDVKVGDDGTTTVTYPDGSKDTIPGDQLVQGQKGDTTDADKITPTVPGDKVTVKDPSHLTDDEKNQVKNNVDNANKDKFPGGTDVKVGDDGTTTVTYPDGSKDTIPGDQLVQGQKGDTTDAGKITPTVPGDKVTVKDPSHLTDDEKNQVKNNVDNANKDKFPAGTEVTVGDDGTATVTYPDGSKDTIPGDQLVQGQKGDTTDAGKITPTVSGDKVTVKDPSHLTDDEKNQVKNNVDNANKDKFPAGTEVTVGDDGTATVTYPDGSKDTIPGDQLVQGQKGDTTDAGKITPTVPGDKVTVKDPSHLTDDEKNQVKNNVDNANKDKFPGGTDVKVGDDGTTTVTYPDGSKDTIPGDQLVQGQKGDTTDADKITPTVPGNKVTVKDPSHLTDDEKNQVKNNVDNANKDKFPGGTDVKVGDDGTTTVTYPDGSKDTIPGDQLVQGQKGDTTDAGKITPTVPGDKVTVKDPSHLTDDEKNQVKNNVDNANKDKFPAGTEVTVGDDGTATVTYPDGSKDTIPGDQLVQGQKGDTTDAGKITPTVSGDKVTVKDPSHLTDDEKNQVKNNVDNANKDKFPGGTDVKVGDDGTTTVTYPDGSKDTIPGSDLVRQSTDADKTTPSVPETKVPVADPSHLTDSEKDQVKTNVTDANKDNLPSGSQITVGNDGTTTVTYPDGSKDTIPGDKVLEGKSDVKSDAKSDADKNEPKEPGDKVKVDDPNKLTDSEKEELSNNLEKLNPGTVVTIADDGTATLTYPDGSTNTIPGSQLVTAKGNGNTTNSNVKVTPTNTNNKINKDNNSLGKNTANAKAGELPQTGETNDSQKLSVIGMALMGILGLFGLGKKRKKD
ncbi:LEA family epithelial adhesin [Ligilactobacillus salivarius]